MKWHKQAYTTEVLGTYLQQAWDYLREMGSQTAYRETLSCEERATRARELATQVLVLPLVLNEFAQAAFDYGYSRVRLSQVARAYCERRFPGAVILSSNEETRYDEETDQWAFVFYRDYHMQHGTPNGSGEPDPVARLYYAWKPPLGWVLTISDCDPTPAWARDDREGEYGDPSMYE